MNSSKKALISGVWILASIAIFFLVQALRHIGTTWINEPGFLRVLFLAALSLSAFVPLVLAVMVWFGRPKSFYRKLK